MTEDILELEKPDFRKYNLDDEKIAFFQKINEQKEKEGGILLFAFSFSIIATLIFFLFLSIFSPTSLEKEDGLFLSIVVIWWCMFCAVFAIGIMPVIKYILVPFIFVYDLIYKEIYMFLYVPKIKIQLAKTYELQYQKYYSDLALYERKIEVKRRNIEEELKRLAQIERERIRQEKLKEKNYWLSMSGYTFEKEIEYLYKKIGFEVNRTKYSGDGGVDLILHDNIKNKIVVQCKNHKNPIGPSIVRELYGVMISENASKAVLICSGGFTEGVFAFARNKNIELLDLNKIIELSRSYQ